MTISLIRHVDPPYAPLSATQGTPANINTSRGESGGEADAKFEKAMDEMEAKMDEAPEHITQRE